jgi:hypothetical protein
MENIYFYLLIFFIVICLILFFVIYALWNTFKNDEKDIEVSRKNAHRYYLNVIRREFANQIISKDRVLFMELERKAEDIERKISKMNNSEFNMELVLMQQKYPQIMDFDFIGENNGEYLSYFDYRSSDLFWEFWDDSEENLEDCWSQHEHSRNSVRANYLDIVKYSAMIIRWIGTIYHPSDYKYTGNASTGTNREKMIEVWKEEHGERMFQRAKLKS